jgi:hypothetical protein
MHAPKRHSCQFLRPKLGAAACEVKQDSGVGMFFDYEKGRLGLFELMDVKAYAASILDRNTYIMTRDSL